MQHIWIFQCQSLWAAARFWSLKGIVLVIAVWAGGVIKVKVFALNKDSL